MLDLLGELLEPIGEIISDIFEDSDFDTDFDSGIDTDTDYIPDSYSSVENQSNVSFGSRYDHINSIYDHEISSAEDKLLSDLDRISEEGAYPWENAEQTLESDKHSIEYWNNCKADAMRQADINQAKQDYWNSISDYAKERMGKKIHG